jgi:hypothetical protein
MARQGHPETEILTYLKVWGENYPMWGFAKFLLHPYLIVPLMLRSTFVSPVEANGEKLSINRLANDVED